MTDIERVRLSWTGFIGGPGVSTFYALSGSDLVTDLRELTVHMANNLPPVVTLQVEPNGDIISAETGVLSGAWTSDGVEPVVGSGAVNYAAPVGMLTNWLTADIAAGHRIKGKTYWVPASDDAFDDDGTLKEDVKNSLQTYCQDMVDASASNLQVWHRPKGSVAGSTHDVTTALISDKPCVLTSRRD